MCKFVALYAVVVLCAGAFAEGPDSITDPSVNWPDGHALVCRLDAGVSEVTAGGITINTKAKTAALTDPATGLHLVLDASDSVHFNMAGLVQEEAYVLQIEWWDVDGSGRRQSVQFLPYTARIRAINQPAPVSKWVEVLPPTVPVAYHGGQATFSRVLLPIPAEMLKGFGLIEVSVKKEDGPSAVLSSVSLLKRTGAAKAKRVLVITGDDYKGHRWRETGPELARILRQDPRLEVSITESPAILGSYLLSNYDAVVLHCKNYAERLPMDPSAFSGLSHFIARGGGVVVPHFGCGAFQEWNGFVKAIGRVWDPKLRGHDKYGPFEVRIADPAHNITSGLVNFKTEDELYTCLTGDTPIHVLCDAVSNVDGKTYPMAFIVEGGAGRVFTCTLGHDVNSLQSEGARDLYRRATLWAAGLE